MEETLLHDGRRIRLDVHVPPAAHPLPALVLLHGSGGNIGFWLNKIAPHLQSAGIALFAPHYFDRTGTARADLAAITDGVHVPLWLDTLDRTVASVAARPEIDPHRIALVGVSLGAFLSLAFAAICSASPDLSQRTRLRCLIELSGGLVEPYAALATPAFPPTLILHGAEDEIVPVAQAHALDRHLTTLGVAHDTRIFAREGHWFSGSAQMQILLAVAGFLSTHLK